MNFKEKPFKTQLFFNKGEIMPYIELKTNKHLEDNIKQEINKLLDENISIFKGKSKEWLMVNILDNLNLHFQGNDDECLIIEVNFEIAFVIFKLNSSKEDLLTSL